MLAENYSFLSTVAEYCLNDITEKLGDAKNSSIADETLTAIAEAMGLDSVANEMALFAFNQKNPKIQQETLLWISKALTEFGFAVNTKSLIEHAKRAVSATNPGIRTAAITLLGTMYLYVGKPLLAFFENEKPALKQQIGQECEKFDGQVPPPPIRQVRGKGCDDGNDEEQVEGPAVNIQKGLDNVLPRTDISNSITETLLNELSDKNWMVRNEALKKIANILTEAKFIKESLGDLPQGLAQRLSDSNIIIALSTLGLCETLAAAMGPPIKQYIRVLFPGFLQCLGDSKAWIRTAAISCINKWGEQGGYKEFFDGEMIGDALKTDSPTLQSELWTWLAEKLPGIPPKEIPEKELTACLPVLYSNIEDCNLDVRKNAQEAVHCFMTHLPFETMMRQTEMLQIELRKSVINFLFQFKPQQTTGTNYFSDEDDNPSSWTLHSNKRKKSSKRKQVKAIDSSKDTEPNTIFLGGFPQNVKKNDVANVFSKFGEIQNIDLKKDSYTGKSLGYGFITFQNHDAVSKVVHMEHFINGIKIDVGEAFHSHKVCIRFLQDKVSLEELELFLKQKANITKIEHQKGPGDSYKNHCIVTLETQKDVDALLSMNQTLINLSEVKIDHFNKRKYLRQKYYTLNSDEVSKSQYNEFEIHFTNHSPETVRYDIDKYFSQFGKIIKIVLTRGFGFVQFDNKESVNKILSFDRHILKGSELLINKVYDREIVKGKLLSYPMILYTTYHISVNEIENHFIEHGLLCVQKIKDSNGGFKLLFDTKEKIVELLKKSEHLINNKKVTLKACTHAIKKEVYSKEDVRGETLISYNFEEFNPSNKDISTKEH